MNLATKVRRLCAWPSCESPTPTRRHTYCRLHGEQASRRSKTTYDSERERRRRRGTSEPARVRLDASDEARGYRSARRGGRRRLLEVRPTHTTGRTVGTSDTPTPTVRGIAGPSIATATGRPPLADGRRFEGVVAGGRPLELALKLWVVVSYDADHSVVLEWSKYELQLGSRHFVDHQSDRPSSNVLACLAAPKRSAVRDVDS